ncbi:MAG: signal peptidase I [Clostridia bacterium]|nr:signal peptidase I [Clostridia bacterium]
MAGRHKRTARIQWLCCIGIVLLLLAFTMFVWFAPLRISGNAMAPTLIDGEIVFFNRIYKHVKSLERGEMIVYKDGNGQTQVGRIIALSGETAEIIEGEVRINNRYRADESDYVDFAEFNMAATEVEYNCVLVLFDSRSLYQDGSAYPAQVSLNDVVGVVQFSLTFFEFFTNG